MYVYKEKLVHVHDSWDRTASKGADIGQPWKDNRTWQRGEDFQDWITWKAGTGQLG